MQMRKLRRSVAVIMSVIMALSSSGITSLAATEDSGKKTITLHAAEGKFITEASPSDATPATASNATRKVEAYEKDGKYWLRNEDIPYNDLRAPEGEGYLETPVWLKKEGDAASAVTLNEMGEYDVTDTSNLYAGWLKAVSGNSTSIDVTAVTALGLSKDQALIIDDLPAADKISNDKIIADIKQTYTNIGADDAIQLNMSLTGEGASAAVEIRMPLPADFLTKAADKSIVVISYGANNTKVIEPQYIRGADGAIAGISFTLSDFGPLVIVTADKITVATPSVPGSSGGGGGSSSSTKSENILYGTWGRNDIGWYFLTTSGRYAQNEWGKINGVWYYFNNDQYMVTGWLFVGNNWYYLNPAEGSTQGAMQTGWLFDPAYNAWFYLSGSGAMLSDWQKINNIWYYLNPVSDGRKGAMYANQWIDGYYVNQDGAWIEGMAQ